MALDEKTLERMLKAQKDALERAKPAARPAPAAAPADRTDLFEEYQKPDLKDHPRTGKGLNAMGYQFPPEPGGTPPLTKANLAKGIGLPPPAPRAAAPTAPAAPAAPVPVSPVPAPSPAGRPEPAPSELVQKDTLFEEYQRPDLKQNPRTGKGIRAAEQPKSAKEILAGWKEPETQVITPRRSPVGSPAAQAPHGEDVEADAAHLDAEADLAAAAALTMSHSINHGPAKVVTDEDPFLEMPPLPPGEQGPDEAPLPSVPAGKAAAPASPATAQPPSPMPRQPPQPHPAASPSPMATRPVPAAAPSFGPAARAAAAPLTPPTPSSPHRSDAPALRPGSGPRIAIVQADFNHEVTQRMAEDATAYARQLGASVVHHLHVAGAFDIPLTAKVLAERADVDAVVAIGCIIQGETGHDRLIAREVARKLADLAFQAEKPIGLAVTGPRMTREQALARIHVGRHAVAAVTQQWRGLQALAASPALAH